MGGKKIINHIKDFQYQIANQIQLLHTCIYKWCHRCLYGGRKSPDPLWSVFVPTQQPRQITIGPIGPAGAVGGTVMEFLCRGRASLLIRAGLYVTSVIFGHLGRRVTTVRREKAHNAGKDLAGGMLMMLMWDLNGVLIQE